MKVKYHSKFIKEHRRLPKHIKKLSEEKEIIFRKNPFDLQLKTHKLHGELKKRYAFSVNYDYRIIFSISKSEKETFYFLSIGRHSIYK